MRLINSTVFPAMTFDHWDLDQREQSVVIVKATIHRESDGWTWRQEQPPIRLEDRFGGDPATSALLEEQEIAPRKPATDLTLRAIAHAPGQKPMEDWPVEITIPERMTYGFHVRGPSQWRRHWLRGWRLDRPSAVRTVRIAYDLAYGGSVEDDEGTLATHEYNPAGCGHVTDKLLHAGDPVPAPQIGLLPELLRQDISDPMAVHGFGPIARTWLPRRGHAGTYDEAWLATRHPHLPDDFDPRYWNSAPGPLQFDPHLRGDEEVRLRNLHPGKPDYRLRLPGVAPRGLLTPTNAAIEFTLDTVMLDIASPLESEHSATLIWRAEFPASDSHEALQIDMVRLGTQAEQKAGNDG